MSSPAPAPAGPKPILELTTLAPIDRPFITIDGARYDLRTPAEFGLVSLNRLDQMAAKVNAIQTGRTEGPLSDEDATSVTEILKTIIAEILIAPASVRDPLLDIQRLAILQSFTPASTEGAPPAKPRNRATRRRTGATSSRASRGSTARPTG